MMECEVYKLDCGACGETVQLPSRAGQAHCPNCGSTMRIEWHGARVDIGAQKASLPLEKV
jgi:predicted RNA-binding Zn-ribbon protein involved in translation (DUF1610 family)